MVMDGVSNGPVSGRYTTTFLGIRPEDEALTMKLLLPYISQTLTHVSTEVVHGALRDASASVGHVVPLVQPQKLQHCILAEAPHRLKE